MLGGKKSALKPISIHEAMTMPRRPTASASNQIVFGLGMAVCALLIFFNLGAGGLHTLDEARHAVVAQNILRSGDWLDLTFRAEPYANKPPLKFWLSAATFHALGVSPLTVRLWSALFGLGAVVGTLGLGRALGGRWVGVAAAAMLATSSQFLYTHGARTGELDSALLCWIVLAMWGFWHGADSRRAFLLGCLAAGLAGMTKHLAFTLEILAIWALWMTLSRRWRAMPRATLLAGLAVTAAVVLPWHLLQWARHGSEFWAVYMGREVGTRAFTNEANAGPFAYVMWLKDGLYPWSWFLPLIAWDAVRRRPDLRGPGVLLTVWIAVIAVVICVGRVKYSWYALPLYPALCVVGARWFSNVWTTGMDRWHWAAAFTILWLLAISPTTATSFNAFLEPAMLGGLTVDLGGRIATEPGGWRPWTLVVVAVIWCVAAVLGKRVAGSGKIRPIAMLIMVLATASLAYVVPSLRLADSRTDLDRFVTAVQEHVAATPRVGVWWAGGRDVSDLEVFSLRSLGIETDKITEDGDLVILCPPLPYLRPRPGASPRPEGREIVRVGGYLLIAP